MEQASNGEPGIVSERYRWSITVRTWDHYGHRIVQSTPTVVVAGDQDEVTRQVRAMFNAEFDSFRKFWSHDWTLQSVEAIA